MRPDPMIDFRFGYPEGPGIVPETILPEQFFRPSAALPPEKRLMLAVLEAALLDLQRSAGARTPRARRLADGPPLAIRLAKRMMYKQREMTLENALEDAALNVMITNPSEDVREGIRAFREKQKPNFKGR